MEQIKTLTSLHYNTRMQKCIKYEFTYENVGLHVLQNFIALICFIILHNTTCFVFLISVINNYFTLTGIPAGQRPSGKTRRRWEDRKDIGINTRNWVYSTQDRDYWRVLVNAAS